jgi:hypothetical protein
VNSLHLLLLDLLRMAETPLYSAYGWVGREAGRRVAMSEFLGMVWELMERGLLRLWAPDDESLGRTELFEVPPDLEERYAALGHTDDSYDPFRLSLTLGSKAERDVELDWQVDLDFARGRFRLLARATARDDALQHLTRYFADVDLIPEKTTPEVSKVRVIGRVVAHGVTEAPNTPLS